MPIIAAHEFTERQLHEHPLREKIYNGFDTTGDYEIDAKLIELYGPQEEDTNCNFELGMQAPALEMMLRGFRVDPHAHQIALQQINLKLDAAKKVLNALSRAVQSKGVNYNSGPALRELFYDRMKLPRVQRTVEGEITFPMDRKILEQLANHYWAEPLVEAALLCRDLSGSKRVLDTEIGRDWRWRCSYNIGGTTTFRWSSSKFADGTGSNFQNITEELRRIFISDSGWKLYGIDLEQADAREVGWFCGTILGDWSYLDACECLTEDHEVLTLEGWISVKETPTTILAWNKTGNMRFEEVVWNRGITKNFIEAENRNISVRGTFNHDMPVFGGNKNNKLMKKHLSQIIVAPNYRAPITGRIVDSHGKDEPLAALLAAFQAYGTKDSFGKVHWTFKKDRKITAMRNLLTKLHLSFSEYNLSTGTRFYLHAGQGQDKWKKNCDADILTWNRTSLIEFCESHYIWDASVTEDNYSIVNKSRLHLEWLATAFMLIGKATTLHSHKDNYWELTVKNNTTTQYRSCKIDRIETNDPIDVWCPTTSTGFFMVRRKGRIFVSGNSGDLHTQVTRICYPEWAWSNDPAENRNIANRKFYRHFTYRDASKRIGHGTNFFGKPPRIHEETKIPLKVVREFQPRYFAAFPCIQRMHQWVATELQTKGHLTNVWGQRRDFLGRRGDDETLRQGIAYMFQSATGTRLNLGLWRLWKRMGTRIQLLSQLHDAVYFQARETDDEAEVLAQAMDCMRIPLTHQGRTFTVPGEAQSGWNWGHRWRLDSEGNKEEWNGKGLDKIGAKR